MIDVSKSYAITGWMHDSELHWLAEQALTHQIIVEVGSYLGRSTRALADHCSGVVYALDDWYGPRDVDLTEKERREAFSVFKRNMRGTLARVVPVLVNHAAIDQWIYKAPDMVFIDGAHEYDRVRRDIEFWKAWAAPKALISGHDAGYAGVDKAVSELLPGATTAPQTSIWYLHQ